jgi:ATP-dependent protease ClpP protease subunit/phage head maturation protease
VTSIHVRRLESRVARTTARFIEHADTKGAGVADLPNMKLPWYTVRDQADGAPAAETPTVFIFDEIGGSFGVDANQFIAELEAITAPTIRLRINSPGGSVFDAINIHSALLHHPAKILVYVDSLAASAASIIAMAGNEIVMMPGSQMMIHDASALEDGTAADMAKMNTFLNRQSQNVADIYAGRAGGDAVEWRDLMLAETWMFAQEAVDAGLADRIEERKAPDAPMVDESMTRSFDLSQYRYAGRREAPTPVFRRRPRPTQRRGDGQKGTPALVSSDSGAARREAAAKRAERFAREGLPVGGQVRGGIMLPNGAARRLSTKDLAAPAQLRAKMVERGGKTFYQVEGYFTVYERGYEMWDWAGPYTEIVTRGSGKRTIGSNPDVVFLVNHSGLAMARTVADTLELWDDATGGGDRAFLNPTRQDVKDLVAAIDDGTITEQSYAFMIESGEWSPDFTEFRINDYELDRGDVSAVNYGANPYTSVAARSREILDALEHLPAGAARVALDRLNHRADLGEQRKIPAVEHVGRGSVAKFEAMLAEDD